MQELLRQLCARVAPALPELAVGKMALELLAAGESGNWDAAMAGAMALLTILAAAPGRLAGGGSGTATEVRWLLGVVCLCPMGGEVREGESSRKRCPIKEGRSHD